MQVASEDQYPRRPVNGSRRAVYVILVLLSLGSSTICILNVRSDSKKTPLPFLSANDRSRWCTIQAIVNHGTYVIDDVIALPGWNTIDKVRHVGRDGQMHYYSSKPPLMPTLLSAKVWLLQQVTGAELGSHPFLIGRLTLLLTNLPPLLICIAVAISFAERWGSTEWGRIYTVAVASLATFLSTFSFTINNHLPAAAGTAVTLWAVDAIWQRRFRQPWWFVLAGFAAAWTAANELPALSMLALITAVLLTVDAKRTLLFFTPAVVLVAAAFFTTNYLAHASWAPPYAHPDWYDYPDTYWSETGREGLDRGEPSRTVYALHTLLGHHGFFSLTPVWLLSSFGLVLMFRRGKAEWAAVITILTLTCLVFYVGFRPVGDRNYGGVTCGFRWLFWLIPLWTVALIPAADELARLRGYRWAGWGMFAWSLVSTWFPAMNPWQHPWLPAMNPWQHPWLYQFWIWWA